MPLHSNRLIQTFVFMIKVGIIEDHQHFRQGLTDLLHMADGFQCTGAFATAEEGIAKLSGKEDILLLDINLPKMSGIDAITVIKQKFPQTKIVMLTMLDDDNTVLQAIVAGANGYLLKKTKPEKLLRSLTECIDGGSPMTGSIASKVLSLFKQYIPQKNNEYDLTKREIEILNFLVDGFNNQKIAKTLCISYDTVRNHIRHIYKKLQVHSKSQAVVKALRENLV